ncbi:hypothetical protein GOP47_0018144 [Adiantum capillus-veneris]|uniref:Pentatricopeptide repeat-containing protein n=1 Tax=Adiantum capillus-veneris TaxID=13818 RepID=A0A9D4ZCH6_ADICA|nr:hypothetical protein GOP47_0018144 [Adiantum capillus-veneris]
MHSTLLVCVQTLSYHVDPSSLQLARCKICSRKPGLTSASQVVSLDYNGLALLSSGHDNYPGTQLHELLRQESLHSPYAELPSAESFVNDLKNCTENKDLAHAEKILLHVCSHGLEPHGFLGHRLVPMFVSCGNVGIALQIFSRIDYCDKESWSSLLEGYLHIGNVQDALNLFRSMHANTEFVRPCKSTFMAFLKSCAGLRSLEQAQEVHAEIVKEDLENDIYVGSTLIDVYIKCGSLTDAREVFDELPVRNVVSWNALIAGYARQGLLDELESCLDRLENENLSPDSITYAFCVKGCINAKSIPKGLEMHAQIAKEELESVTFLGHALVDMYAKFGMLLEAREVFDSLPVWGVVAWTSLMTGYAENGLHILVLSSFKEMHLKGIDPDAATYACVLKACGNLADADKGYELHAEVVREGLERDPYVGKALVDMYAKYGFFSEAHEVLKELLVRDVFSWTTLISGYAENGMVKESIFCLKQMKSENVLPNPVTYVCCLKACGNVGSLHQGMEVHSDICMEGYDNDPFVANTLIDMYAKCGLLEEAQETFECLPARDVVSWTVLVTGYAECGLGEEALKSVDCMQKSGLSLDNVIFVSCLKAVGMTNAPSKGQEFHTEIVKVASESEPFVGNALVDMYAKCGLLDEALDVFVKLPSRDIVSWNTLVSEYAERSLAEEAVEGLKCMKLEGMIPDRITFASALKACSSAGAIALGLSLHVEIAKTGFESDPYVGNTLLDMYARCGFLQEAKEIFDHLPIQDVVTWNAVLTGLNECDQAEEVLAYLDRMTLAGVAGDAVTFVCSLRACGHMEDINKAREIHAGIAIDGFENSPRVGTSLIDTYGRCGQLAEAAAVFEELPNPDVVSWNALIAGYADHAHWEGVSSCLERMQQSGFSPTSSTYIFALRVCCNPSYLYKGQQLHSALVMKGLESDLVGNNLVSMYARCGSMTEAQYIFEELEDREETLSWTGMIAGFAELGLYDNVVELLDQMQLEGLSIDACTFVCSLRGCGIRSQLEWSRIIHLKITKEGFDVDLLVGNTLVDMYAKCGSLTEAQQMLDQMPSRDVVSWNALIAAHAEHNFCEDVQKILEEMRSDGVSPDAVTLACILKAVSQSKSIDLGKKCHMEVLSKGYEGDSFVGNCLIDMYAKCEAIAEADDVFQKVNKKDVFSWNAMVSGYVDCGLKSEALALVKQMIHEDVPPDAVTFSCALKACDSAIMVTIGQRLHREAVSEGFDDDTFLGNTLVDMYCKCGLLMEAREVFDELPARDVVSWNTIIAGYSEQGLGEEALDAVQEMESEGVQLDVYMSVSCLKACGSIGATGLGQELHSENVKKANEVVPFVQNTLVDMYGKLGNMADAFCVFNSLSERGIVVWNALIAGYARHGQMEAVSCMLKDMSKEGKHPNEITFLIVLTLYSHLGLVEEGQDYFKSMWEKSIINVSTRHLNCMIDLLSRTGQLDEAAAMLGGLQSQEDSVAWRTILSSCRNWNNLELGQEAFENLSNLDASRPAIFVLMGNMYADF